MSTVTVRTIQNFMTKQGRETWQEQPGRPVLDYCPRVFAEYPHLGIIHNGEAIDKDRAEHAHMRGGDEVIFYRKPRDPATLVLITISILLITYYVTKALTAGARPRAQELDDSPTFGQTDGIVNTVAPGTRIPLIYGTHRVGGQIIQQYLERKRLDPNRADARASAISTLLGVCSGEIKSIGDVRADKSRNSAGVFEFRRGSNRQSAINGFTDVRTQFTKDIKVTNVGGPYTTTTENECDVVEILFRFAGLFRTSDRGQFLQKQVDIRIEYKIAGTSSYSADSISISEKTRNQFDVFWRSPVLPRAKYDLRITRITADDNDATGLSDFSVLAVIEIIDDVQTYPGLAMYCKKAADTRESSGGTPTYDALVEGKLVRIFTGLSTYTTAWSNNPAWCLLDFLTDKKYGLGAFIDDDRVDIQSFIDAAAFCALEELELNVVLDGSLNAFDTIRQFCFCGRLLFLLRGDKWTVRPDKPEEPVQFFSMGRIMKGSFTAFKSSKADSANYLIGEFWNKELDYEKDALPKEDPTVDPSQEQIEATVNLLGCTSAAQANKILNLIMLSNRLQKRTVEFEVGVEALALEAGDVFAVSHDVPGWGLSGKLRDIDESGTSLWLDRTVTLEVGKEYELTVFHDKHEGDPTTRGFDVVRVTNNPEITDRLSVSGDWIETPAKGHDYSFGELTKSYVLYRCVGVTRGTALARRRIRGVEYNADVYGTDLTVLPQPSVSSLPNPLRLPDDVTDLRLAERQVYAEDGTLSTAIDVFFNLPIIAGVRAEVFWRENGFRTWESVGIFNTGYATITQNIRSPNGAYEVAVAAISQFGVRKAPEDSPFSAIVTVGVTRQPDNVSNFRVDRTMEGIVFTWDPVNAGRNFDLSNYEIRSGMAWDTGVTIGEPVETRFFTTAFVKGENTFLIKAKNTAGKFSPIPQAVVIEVDARINENIVYTRTENPTFPGSKEAFTVVSSKLLLNTDDQVVAWRNSLQSGSLGGSKYLPGGRRPGFRVAGTYTTDKFQITALNAERALVSYKLLANQLNESEFWSATDVSVQSWGSPFALERAWSVAPDGKVLVRVETRFSTLTSAEADFGPWQEREKNVEVSVKWAQARIHVEVVDPAFTVEIEEFEIYFDVPDRRVAGSATTSSSGVVTVTFPSPFNNPPKAVVCTIQSASASDDIVRGTATATDFPLSVFNAGSRVVRTVEYVATGF